MAKKIPATSWERSWLMKYFMNIPSELTGNYFRYIILIILYHVYATDMYVYVLFASMCSVCLKAIRTDALARKMFHPKHMKDSQAVKNVSEYVLKCVLKVPTEGYPEWYMDTLPAA
jgi:hypothetical protein